MWGSATPCAEFPHGNPSYGVQSGDVLEVRNTSYGDFAGR